MTKDWTGNKKTTFAVLGASNHSFHERAEHDFYATEPQAIDALLEKEVFDKSIPVWENCCGEGHLSKRLEELGYTVISTDLIDREFGIGNIDFFKETATRAPYIITNPPYKYAKKWVEHSLELLPVNGKLALFLPIQFLESEERRQLFENNPPIRIHVCTKRILCGLNGDFTLKDKQGNTVLNKDGTPKKMSSAKCYAWFVWIKGHKGCTNLDWVN